MPPTAQLPSSERSLNASTEDVLSKLSGNL
jgi:hypothetical protein